MTVVKASAESEAVMAYPTDGLLHHLAGFEGLRWSILSCERREERFASLMVFDSNMVQAAMLRWEAPVRPAHWTPDHPDALGEILALEVAQPWRRRGLATAVWKLANDLTEELRWLPPGHSPTRTPEGDAWARAVGGLVPKLEAAKPFEYFPPRT